MKEQKKKIAVLMGGVSKEREISLRTGSAISASLKKQGYDVIDVDVGSDVLQKLSEINPAIAVLALHGKYGEDGCIQGALEILGIPYTGSGVLGSSVGMDKAVCRVVAEKNGIKVPRGLVYFKDMDVKKFVDEFSIKFPVIVKPSREGSTINVTIVEKSEDLLTAINTALASDSKVLVEEYIKGVEITVGIINGKVLTPLEVAPKGGFYDYKSKYTKGMTEYIVPARISEGATRTSKEMASRIYKAIDCTGIARADFIVLSNDEPVFLEINTMPGMTELSLVPKAAVYDKMSFDEVVVELLKSATLKEKN